MNGQPDPQAFGTLDLSFFSGAYLNHVSFDIGELYLHFERPAIVIRAQQFATLLGGELNTHPFEEAQHLRPFLNKDVTLAKWAGTHALIITFDGGDEIHILESGYPESYVIDYAGQTIAV